MAKIKDTPLQRLLELQELQDEFDTTKKQAKVLNSKVRSIAQKIPEKIRLLREVM